MLEIGVYGGRNQGDDPMNRTAIRVCTGIILITILGSAMSAGHVFAEAQIIEPRTPPPNPMNVAADALILRPVGLVMIPVMGLVYCLSYPFAKMAGNEQETYQSVLGDTIDFTFYRPMGRGEPFD
jgi:hypothetical protein